VAGGWWAGFCPGQAMLHPGSKRPAGPSRALCAPACRCNAFHCRAISDKTRITSSKRIAIKTPSVWSLVEHKDGTFCGEFVKPKPTKIEGFFEMSNALSHFKSKGKHLGSAAYEKANEKVQRKTAKVMATKQMTTGESMSTGKNSQCESEEFQLKKQALWYIYGTPFTDEYFRDMIHSQNSAGKVIVESGISSYVDAEHARFCDLLNRALIKANIRYEI
jgi:hypothetical protein